MPVLGNLGTIYVRDKYGKMVPIPVIRGENGTTFETGFGLELEDGVLSAEVGAASFHEITNAELQEIINKVKTEG